MPNFWEVRMEGWTKKNDRNEQTNVPHDQHTYPTHSKAMLRTTSKRALTISTYRQRWKPATFRPGDRFGPRGTLILDEKIINEGKVRPSLSSTTIMCLRPDSHVMQHRGFASAVIYGRLTLSRGPSRRDPRVHRTVTVPATSVRTA